MVIRRPSNMQDNSMQPTLVSYSAYDDHRGSLLYNNSFTLNEVKRMYVIEQKNVGFRRGWRAHKLEQRWFVATKGITEVKVVAVHDFENPDRDKPQIIFELKENKMAILHIPKGYATCLTALVPNSSLMVFADSLFEDAHLDNYVYPSDYFDNKV